MTVLTNYVQYCRHDTSGKIRFTTCTSGQVVSTGQTELSSGKCISLVYKGRQLSCRVVRMDKFSRPDRQSCRVETRSTRTDAKEQAPYTLCMPRSLVLYAMIPYEPREGTSALHTVYLYPKILTDSLKMDYHFQIACVQPPPSQRKNRRRGVWGGGGGGGGGDSTQHSLICIENQ